MEASDHADGLYRPALADPIGHRASDHRIDPALMLVDSDIRQQMSGRLEILIDVPEARTAKHVGLEGAGRRDLVGQRGG